LQKTVATAADSLLNVWPDLLLRAGSGVCVEEVKRFDSSIDAIAERAGFFGRFWCPHSSDFMNWRYLDHPLGNSVAYAALEGDRPVGYCVVTMAGEVATVMELSHVSDSLKVPRALLLRAIRAARACGCRVIKCIATPALRSWPLLHGAGFRSVSSKVYFLVRGEAFPGLRQLENWQLGAGDIDSL